MAILGPMTKTIVVTGATGTIGRRAVELLAAQKAPVTALVHSADKAAPLEQLGARTAVGDFNDRASLERAFAGADTVVLITPPGPHAYEQTITALEAAKTARVRKIVRVSALKAGVDGPTDNTRQHGRTEAAIKASGLTYVILRPHLFFQNLFGSLPTILGEGKVYFGVGDGKMGLIDTRDASDAVVAAATRSDFDGETIELTGPASITYHDVAAALSRALGREITYVPVPPAAAGEAIRGWGDWAATVITDYCTAYSKNWGDFTTGEVQRLTGHAPRSADDFAREVLAPAARG